MSLASPHYPASSSAAFRACDASCTAADADAPITFHHTTRQQRVSSTASTEEALDDRDADADSERDLDGSGALFNLDNTRPLPNSSKHSADAMSHNQQQQRQQRRKPSVPNLPPHHSPSLPPTAVAQSAPSNTRRLSSRRGSNAATPSSQPSSPPSHVPRQHSDTATAASVAPSSTHPSASYHPDVPLHSAPSFTLHHRPHHLSKFLSSPLGSALLLNKLRSGTIFLKHGQRGAPHYRYVWVREEEGGRDRVCWAELRRRDKVRGSMDVRTLLRVDEGHGSSGAFARSRGSDARRCFTVVGEDRTLDLECISEEDREMWLIAFAFLIEHTRRGGSLMGGGVDVAGIAPSISLVSALELLCEQNHALAQSRLSSTPCHSSVSYTADEGKEVLSSTATTGASSCYSTPERHYRSGEMESDGQRISYTTSAASHHTAAAGQQRQHASPPYPHVSPTSQVRVSHVNRFEVIDIDIVDDGLPIPPPHHIAATLPLTTTALPPPAAGADDPRLVRLHTDLELYKADNKRLLLSHAHKMMSLQREIDALMAVNARLRSMKLKADKAAAAPARRVSPKHRSGADSDGDIQQHSDDSADD